MLSVIKSEHSRYKLCRAFKTKIDWMCLYQELGSEDCPLLHSCTGSGVEIAWVWCGEMVSGLGLLVWPHHTESCGSRASLPVDMIEAAVNSSLSAPDQQLEAATELDPTAQKPGSSAEHISTSYPGIAAELHPTVFRDQGSPLSTLPHLNIQGAVLSLLPQRNLWAGWRAVQPWETAASITSIGG